MQMRCTIAALFSLVCACATGQSQTSNAHATHASKEQASTPHYYAVVNGEPLGPQDISSSSRRRIDEAENELKQRQLHALWVGVEEAIDSKLLEQEAKRRGMSTEELRKAEIDSRATSPTDEDVRSFYDTNEKFISVPYEQVSETLRDRLMEKQREELETLLMERLRDQVEIRYALPIPDLPRVEVSIEDQPIHGPDAALVTLVEFSDFECPFCARGRRLIEKLQSLYPEQLRVVFRDFPLRQHPHARPAAEAAQCAHEQKKFWPYHDKLFDNADALTTEDLRRYAKDVGLELESFEKCLTSNGTKNAIARDERDGAAVGVDGTPSLFINGIKLVGLLPIPLMRAIIDNELNRSHEFR